MVGDIKYTGDQTGQQPCTVQVVVGEINMGYRDDVMAAPFVEWIQARTQEATQNGLQETRLHITEDANGYVLQCLAVRAETQEEYERRLGNLKQQELDQTLGHWTQLERLATYFRSPEGLQAKQDLDLYLAAQQQANAERLRLQAEEAARRAQEAAQNAAQNGAQLAPELAQMLGLQPVQPPVQQPAQPEAPGVYPVEGAIPAQVAPAPEGNGQGVVYQLEPGQPPVAVQLQAEPGALIHHG